MKDILNISELLSSKELQKIIANPDFYFQKGQDELKKWLELEVSNNAKEKLLNFGKKYEAIENESKNDLEIDNIFKLLLNIIAYCDTNARDKNLLNLYNDKRALANANVRMDIWVQNLVLFKFDRNNLKSQSSQNALNYLLEPSKNATILSDNHRKQVSENLFNKNYNPEEFVDNLCHFFEEYNLSTKNIQNYTHLLSRILYHIQVEWKDEVIALMAADGTGWQDELIEESDNCNACIIWNSKRPSGTNETLRFLRKTIEEGSSFNFYYSSNSQVNYRATVIDFADSEEDFLNKKWDNNYTIAWYKNNFNEYKDDSGKSASIVFLTKPLEKIAPIPVSEFEFYNGYSAPRQDNISPLKWEPEHVTIIPLENTHESDKINNMNDTQIPLNQILFGPPGTGKTYNTIDKALEILGKETKGKSRKEIKDIFHESIKAGQIVFTTFHQSMSYEDFIEGIKPIEPESENEILSYAVEDGIFKRLCTEAAFSYANQNVTKETVNFLDFSVAYDNFIDVINERLSNGEIPELTTRSGGKVLIDRISANGNIWVKHINSTIKYTVSKKRLNKIAHAFPDLNDLTNINEQFRAEIGGSNVSAYWAVLNAIRNQPQYSTTILVGNTKEYSYDDKQEIIFSLKEEEYKKDNTQKYVLIIDEINRGNVSQIFGELITLIEDDKRLGKDESLKITLPYSKKEFGVPSNLYIIGTMNTADRSVEALDTALRRRFSFISKMPEESLLKITSDGINLVQILQTINTRLRILKDNDHTIGHAWLWNVDNIDDLKKVFGNKILPLLQEYFYNDYEKLGLVLGETFFKPTQPIDSTIFAKFSYGNGLANQYDQSWIQELKDVEELSIEDFKTLENLTDSKSVPDEA